MPSFDALVEITSGLIFSLAQAYGGNMGAAIVTVGLLARLMLMPWTLRLAERGALRQKAMMALRPEIDALRQRFAKKPQRLNEEMNALFKRRDVEFFDTSSLRAAVLQAPFFLLVWSAVRRAAESGGRFLWIPSLTRPDVLLTFVAAAISGSAALLGPNLGDAQRLLLFALPAAVSLLVLWKMSAGVGLYWAASGVVSAAQSLLLQRRIARLETA